MAKLSLSALNIAGRIQAICFQRDAADLAKLNITEWVVYHTRRGLKYRNFTCQSSRRICDGGAFYRTHILALSARRLLSATFFHRTETLPVPASISTRCRPMIASGSCLDAATVDEVPQYCFTAYLGTYSAISFYLFIQTFFK